jgi:uncharacterized membrane protein YfcA
VGWTPRTTLLYPLLCTAAGLIAGLFGVGGGIVQGPLMLLLGVDAEVGVKLAQQHSLLGLERCPPPPAHAPCKLCPALSPPLNPPAQVAAASSATMIPVTAAGSFSIYLAFGLYQSACDYAAALMAIGFLATLAGQLGTTCLVRAVGRRLLVVVAMVALLALASAVMLYQMGSMMAAAAMGAEGAAQLTSFWDICK